MTVTSPQWLADLTAVHPRAALAWCDPDMMPPLAGPERTDLTAARDELRAHLGRWGLVHVGPFGKAAGMALDVRAGRGLWRYAGMWEATVRSSGGWTGLLVRYRGYDIGV